MAHHSLRTRVCTVLYRTTLSYTVRCSSTVRDVQVCQAHMVSPLTNSTKYQSLFSCFFFHSLAVAFSLAVLSCKVLHFQSTDLHYPPLTLHCHHLCTAPTSLCVVFSGTPSSCFTTPKTQNTLRCCLRSRRRGACFGIAVGTSRSGVLQCRWTTASETCFFQPSEHPLFSPS
jgi:hypothetical protein